MRKKSKLKPNNRYFMHFIPPWTLAKSFLSLYAIFPLDDDFKSENKNVFFFCKRFDCSKVHKNKAGYAATEVACGWAGAIFEAIFEAGAGRSK